MIPLISAGISAGTNLLGGFLSRRSAKKQRKKNIQEALAAGVNPILVYGGAAHQNSGVTPMGRGVAAAGDAIAKGIAEQARKEEEKERSREESERRSQERAEDRADRKAEMDLRLKIAEMRLNDARQAREERALSLIRAQAGVGVRNYVRNTKIATKAAKDENGQPLYTEGTTMMEGAPMGVNYRPGYVNPGVVYVDSPAVYGEAGEVLYGVGNIMRTIDAGKQENYRKYKKEVRDPILRQNIYKRRDKERKEFHDYQAAQVQKVYNKFRKALQWRRRQDRHESLIKLWKN